MELDVHLCKDGHMVVNHNFDVDHNSDGLGLIEEYTLRELKQLDFGLWKGVEFKGTFYPHFRRKPWRSLRI